MLKLSYNFVLNLDLKDILPGSEIILSTFELSRFGNVHFCEVHKVAERIKRQGHRCVLEWDILMTESVFIEKRKLIESIDLSIFDAIRVSDSGAFLYLLEETNYQIQLSLENGHHNFNSVIVYEKLAGKRLEKLVLSNEVSFDVLKKYFEKLETQCEILGIGRILLFYSPRKLVTPHFKVASETEVSGRSDETPHQGFKIRENQHGTYMFNPKDYCILDQLELLRESALTSLRIDLRFYKEETIKYIVGSLRGDELFHAKRFKEIEGTSAIRGFFKVNKSKSQFGRLKNQKIQRVDKNYIGHVIDVSKKSYMGIHILGSKVEVKAGSKLKFLTPEGKEKKMVLKHIENSLGQVLESADDDTIFFTDHLCGVSVKTAVYLEN